MRMLVFSDLHRDEEAAERLVERAREVDVVIGAGDYATMRRGLDEIIAVLSAITAPTILIPGNAETDTELWQACGGWRSAQVLHGQAVCLEDADIFGLGGAVPPTPFPWSYDLSEDEAAAKLESCPPGAVLVVHSPPKGYVDEAHGRHLGSRAVLAAIESKHPALVVCGHIHQCWGREAAIGTTPVVNVGPEGRIFEI